MEGVVFARYWKKEIEAMPCTAREGRNRTEKTGEKRVMCCLMRVIVTKKFPIESDLQGTGRWHGGVQ